MTMGRVLWVLAFLALILMVVYGRWEAGAKCRTRGLESQTLGVPPGMSYVCVDKDGMVSRP